VWGHSFLGDFLVFPILIILSKINPKNYHYFLAPLIFLSSALIMTNSRSALVATILGVLFLSIKNKFSGWLKILILLCLTVFLINIFYLSKPSTPQSLKTLDGSRFEYWQEAIAGFRRSPIIGNGAASFDYFNRLYRPSGLVSSIYASNSFLQFLSDHGLIFTSIFFVYIFYGLIYQFKNNNLLFCLGFAALINSLLDPSWSSSGILILSLIFIFHGHPLFYPKVAGAKKISIFFLFVLSLTVLGCYIADSVSNYLYSQKSYDLSLKLNPFNFNSYEATINNNKSRAIKYFGNFGNTYATLIDNNPLPQSETYYYKLFELNPRQGLSKYLDLFNYYYSTSQSDKFDSLTNLMNQKINLKEWPVEATMPHAQIIYLQAIKEWQTGQHETAINNLSIALQYSNGWSHFYIELANAYWNNGQKDLAIDILKNQCPKSKASTSHCLDYLDKHPNGFLLPGTPEFKESINSLFK
jgi:hypothetical protein